MTAGTTVQPSRTSRTVDAPRPRARGGARPGVLRSRTLLVGGTAALVALVAAPAAPAAKASGPAACRTALTATLTTHDPTTLGDRAVATVKLRSGTATNVKVSVTRGGKTIASGTAARLGKGTTSVALKLKRTPTAGAVRVRVTGTKSGCGAVRSSTTYRLRSASLPVRTALRGTTEEGGKTVVRVLLRTVGTRTSSGLKVELRNPLGARVASASVGGRLTGVAEVVLRADSALSAGRYQVVVTGRSAGSKATGSASQSVVLKASSAIPPAAAVADPSRQKVAIDWKGSSSAGKDIAGFVLPGIGYGELVCSAGTQWLRVFPSEQGREASMLTWTYRSWDGNSQNNEKALREALHTQFTGRDFNEGFNKFQPAEKQSTGEFTALLSDRGPIGAPFAPSLVPPVGIHVTWEWDFRDPSNARCHVEAQVVAQPAGAPGVGSAQVLWRGDAAAAGRDTTVVDLPDVGRITLVCQATPAGTRNLRLVLPVASTVTTREGSVDTAVPYGPGPVVTDLPNNGQLQIDTAAGARVLVASRWKVNDPDPAQNSCALAAQSVAP